MTRSPSRKLAEALNEHFFHIVGQVDQRAIPASGETFLVAQLWIARRVAVAPEGTAGGSR